MSPPSKPASSRVSREDAGCAIDALLGFLRARAKQRKAQLFEHDDFIYLHLSVRRFPSTPRVNPYRIPLPHSLHPLDPSRTSLCLIVDDSLAETARSTAAAEKLPFDSVIPLSELRTDYVPFESRRRLCDSYDIFFAERRIITLLPRLIGNYFFKKKKIPLAINISRSGWPEAVRQACRSTLLFFGSGTGIGMKVGRVSMDREEIIDNLMAAIEGAVNHVPKKWANIRCMYIKAVQSVALPIYQVVPEMGMKIDIGSREEAEPLDGIVVQKRDGKSGEGKEKSRKKLVGSKKRKGRIHDVDYVGSELVDGNEDDDYRDGVEEQENDDLGMEKKKKKKKDGKVYLSKGKKAVIDEDDHEEKESGDQFIKLGTGKKMRKRAKKIVNSEVEEHGIIDGLAVDTIVAADVDDHGDDKELLLKMKVKNKGKKGKKISLHASNGDQENLWPDDESNVMDGDDAIATTAANDGDHVDVDLSNVQKRVKNNEKIGNDKKVKKVKKTKLRQ